jgi:hypothetical protein
MKRLLPYEQRVIQREIERVRDERKAGPRPAPETRRISRNDIQELSENFAAILTEKVIVVE